jgi:hypothetical protein
MRARNTKDSIDMVRRQRRNDCLATGHLFNIWHAISNPFDRENSNSHLLDSHVSQND